MQIQLSRIGELRIESSPSPKKVESLEQVCLDVLYCAICRTDAKCWAQGHRDLAMPRVLGHEIVGMNKKTGTLYTVWPGQACGTCRYCLENRENLCEKIKIIGFHSDGGFASQVVVPKASLIRIPDHVSPEYFCFAEPLACIINSFEAAGLRAGQKVIIYGGGVVGLLAGLVAKEQGANPTIIERNPEKIAKANDIAAKNRISILQDTPHGEFHLALNACSDPVAFSHCLLKLRKGGCFAYFSGLQKNEEIDSNLLNLVHYKELQIVGSYGPRIIHMQQAVSLCVKIQSSLALLIEKSIPPTEVADVMTDVLAGKSYKYIIACKKEAQLPITQPLLRPTKQKSPSHHFPPAVTRLVSAISPVDTDLLAAAQAKIDYKTKPLGALGRIERLAVQLCVIQKSLNPSVSGKNIIVFAGDHGVVEEGVSAFPAKVTTEMVNNFLAGGAAINSFCSHYNINLAVADMGVNADFSAHPMLQRKKVAPGTKNFTLERAMTMDHCIRAIEVGATIFNDMHARHPCQIVGFGEMGIGNTSAASAIISAATTRPVEDICGRGTGVDDKGLERKIEVIKRALALHSPDPTNGLELLSTVGGYEIAGIVGAIFAATSHEICVVLDGVISTAAGLCAYLIAPKIHGYLVSGHKSVEIGQRAALEHMNLQPVIDLDLRLGEGTGAAITINTIELACSIMRNMASFDVAKVSTSQ